MQSVQRQAMSAAEAERRSAELIDRIEVLPQLRDLGQTPLLLTIITILHFYEGKLPEDRADLYEDIVQLLLTRWTQQRREAGAPPSLIEQLKHDGSLRAFKDFHLRSVLEKLAYRAHQSQRSADGRGLLDRGIVRDALFTLFREFELPPGPAAEKAELVLTYLEDESGLLQHEGNDQYVLPHLTYEEYLAGCYLVKENFLPLAYRHWQEDSARWREVILLAVGRMVRGDNRDTAAQWLNFLLLPAHGERPRDEFELQQAALLAADCLADLGGKPALIGTSAVSLPDLWERLADILAQVVEDATLHSAQRIRAGMHLGELGDPRPGVCTLPPAMVDVPGGTFVIGYTQSELDSLYDSVSEEHRGGLDRSLNDQPIRLAPFAIGKYPVTNAQYKLFLDDDGYNPIQPWWGAEGQAWLTQRRNRRIPEDSADLVLGIARPNHPVAEVTWYEAQAFCHWLTQYLHDGYTYRLPTEAEWEWAARGAERRLYPWGNEVLDSERANYHRIYQGTTAVGSFMHGATPEGVLDLAGNIFEWTSSFHVPYPYHPVDGREKLMSIAQGYIVLRGGSWRLGSEFLLAASRLGGNPNLQGGIFGFRLARHPTV